MNVLERRIPSSIEFFRRYTQALHAGEARPAYHFIHVFPPHRPFVLDAECRPRVLTAQERQGQWQEGEREAYEAQARCAWRATDEFVGRLRSIGLYDQSAILIESDHGLGVLASPSVEPREPLLGMPMDKVRSYANPLLLVKPPGARGPLRHSSAPTSHFESAPTVLRWLGIDHPLARRPGYLEVAEGERRPRAFVLSGRVRGSEGPPFHLLRIEGPVDQPESWRSLGVFRRFGVLHSDPSALPLPGFAF
jgi:arylsulfatase A-like enzyme